MKTTAADNELRLESIKNLKLIEQVKWEWESAVDSLPQIICLLDQNGGIVRSNKAVENWGLGYVQHTGGLSLHGLLHSDCTDPDCHLRKYQELVQNVVSTGNAAELHGYDKHLHCNLHILLHPYNNSPRRDQSEQQCYAVAVIRRRSSDFKAGEHASTNNEAWVQINPEQLTKTSADFETQITFPESLYPHTHENRTSSFKLIERIKQEWESTVDSLPQVICLIDSAGVILRANRAVENWKLGTVANVRGLNLHEMMHPGCTDENCYLKNIEALASDAIGNGKSTEHFGQDHHLHRQLHVQIHAYTSKKIKETGCAVAVFSDVSELKRSENELKQRSKELEKRTKEHAFELIGANIQLKREIELRKQIEKKLENSRQEYRRLLDAMNEGLVIQDAENRITYVNRRLLKMLNLKRQQMIGHTIAEFIDPCSLSTFKTRQSRQNHKKMTPYELVFSGSNGDKLWVKVSPKAIFDDDKNFVGSFSVLSDITQYIKYENELQASGAALQRLSKDVLQAQEVERKRISAELHDGLGQTLSAIKFCMENVANGSSPEETDQDRRIVVDRRKQFETVIERMQSAIEEVRRISMDLRPTLLDDIGILATLSWFCRESSHSYKDLKISLNVAAILEKDVPESIKVPVFRIVQEAVNNVVKHSKAKEVDINFGKMKDGQIWLSIDDNGSGFVPSSIHGINDVGIGLKTMQERARNSGGDFQLKSSRGRGTHIQVFWPPVN